MSEFASESPMRPSMLSGRELAAELRARTTRTAAALTAAGTPPRLAVVVATADESSAWYVRSIAKAAAAAGIACDVVDLGTAATTEEIRAALHRLSADAAVHGIILQTPLPPGVDVADLTPEIDPAKDVDGANPTSLGRLAAGLPAFAPATAEAVLVGTNPTADGGLVGDVDPDVSAAGLTPVPGGVGPVTTALLLQHTVHAAGRT
ncbi:tetrahydrofolate dehydrogenase/cyclohydrolase catalytic domain-containing protein [Pseudonocardia adelaidensis]